MILADLHNHFQYSHGQDTLAEMYAAAQALPLRWFGLSEHSPLPPGYSCRLYRNGDLSTVFPLYAQEAQALKARVAESSGQPQAAQAGHPAVLFGMELDWIPDRRPFMEELAARYPFDHIIGGLHFLTASQAVAAPTGWDCGQAELWRRFELYYSLMGDMAASGLVDVVAHADFIKVRCFEAFHHWLARPQGQAVVRAALERLALAGVALEVSSAGLRKDFCEIYPAPSIMALAAELGLAISFGSDAHATADIGQGFEQLAAYARSYGYSQSLIFEGRRKRALDF